MPTLESRLPPGHKRLLVTVAGLGMLVYLGLAIAADYPALERALAQLGWSGATLVLALSLLNYGLRFQRWHLYLRELGYRLGWTQHLLMYLAGFMFTVSPAKAGEAVRGVYLREHGVPYADTFAVLFVEHLLDVLAYVLLASLIVLGHTQYQPLLLVAFVFAFALLGLCGHPAIPAWLDRRAAGRPSSRMSGPLQLGARLLRASSRLLRPRLLLPGLALGLVSWSAEGLGLHLICQGLSIDVPPMTAIGVFAIAGLAGAAAFFMPGGIGGMELVMIALLTTLGAPASVAIVATLICRVATLWFAVIVGFVAATLLEFLSLRPAPRSAP